MISDPSHAARMLPKTTSEYINAVSHFYRAEVARMAGWRDRIDRTTNWSITATGALLSLSLSTPNSHHSVILVAMLLVLLLLMIEARRYRFYDVYRRRVRMLEEFYYAVVFEGDASGSDAPSIGWTDQLAKSLRSPAFGISARGALTRRLRRTYVWIFLLLWSAWLIKILDARSGGADWQMVSSLPELLRNAAVGPLPGLFTLASVAAFYVWIITNTLRSKRLRSEVPSTEVHM